MSLFTMLRNIYYYLYSAPWYLFLIIIGVAVAAWTALSLLPIKRRVWRRINLVLALVYAGCVLYMTLFSRSADKRELSLVPFASLALAQRYRDVFNQIAMNILLYVPLGILFPYALEGKVRHPLALTLLIGFSLSLLIESSQYIFSCGLAETDDLISNSLGVCLGMASFLLYSLLTRIKNHKIGDADD